MVPRLLLSPLGALPSGLRYLELDMSQADNPRDECETGIACWVDWRILAVRVYEGPQTAVKQR